jgi:hypothetical protein
VRSSVAAVVIGVACITAVAGIGCRKTPPPPVPVPAAATAAPEVAVAPASAEPKGGHRGGGGGADGGEERAHREFAKVDFPEVPIRAGATTAVKVAWKTPPGTGVNEDAPFKVRWHHSDALAEAPADVKATGTAAKDGFRINVKPLDGAPNATLSGIIDLVVCDMATHAVCVPVRRKIDIEFVVGKTAPAETTVSVDLPQAKAP